MSATTRPVGERPTVSIRLPATVTVWPVHVGAWTSPSPFDENRYQRTRSPLRSVTIGRFPYVNPLMLTMRSEKGTIASAFDTFLGFVSGSVRFCEKRLLVDSSASKNTAEISR